MSINKQARALQQEREKEPLRRIIKAISSLFRTKEEKLRDALIKGDIMRVQRYVDMGADVNFCPKTSKIFTTGDSLLHVLALGKTGFKTYNEYKQVFQVLRQSRLNLNLKNRIGQTPLHNACIAKNLMFVKILIEEKDIDLNAQDVKGLTPMHIAVRSGDYSVVNALIQKTKSFLPDKKGLYPIDYAGFNNLVRYALENEDKNWDFYLEQSDKNNGCFFQENHKEQTSPACSKVATQLEMLADFSIYERERQIDF